MQHCHCHLFLLFAAVYHLPQEKARRLKHCTVVEAFQLIQLHFVALGIEYFLQVQVLGVAGKHLLLAGAGEQQH